MAMTGKVRIGVIGAGVSGMSCAFRLQTEIHNSEVTIVSEDFSPNLTSDGSGGVWEPYDNYNTDADKIRSWGVKTYDYLRKLALSSDSIQAGVSALTIKTLRSKHQDELQDFLQVVDHFHRMDEKEYKAFGDKVEDGYSYTSFTCEPRIYLPWLAMKIIRRGGKIIKRKITDLSEFCKDYDLVINCAALGAAELVKDNKMIPIRGQVIKVRGINQNEALLLNEDPCYYIIPGQDLITVGGTFEKNQSEYLIKEETKERMMGFCSKWLPALKSAEVVYDWCGFRPSRSEGIRLEEDSTWHPTTKVIHNYGHGGIGVTLHWGCAEEVVTLAKKLLRVQTPSKL